MEIKENQVLEYDSGTEETCTYIDSATDAIGLREGRDGELYICEAEGHRIATLIPGESVPVIVSEFEGTPLNGLNNLEIDHDGDIRFIDPDDKDRGLFSHTSVFHTEQVGVDASDGQRLVRLTDETDRPNGILPSPDESRLYVAECTYSPDQETDLQAYPIRGDGSLNPREILHDSGDRRGIDGMTLTESGGIVAYADQEKGGPRSSIYMLSPEGEVLERHPFPESRPTNYTLDGPGCSTPHVADMTGSFYAAETDRSVYVRF